MMSFTDESGASQLMSADSVNKWMEFGSATPVAPLSVDGSALFASGKLGSQRATPSAINHTNGVASVPASGSVTITHSLSRLPVVFFDPTTTYPYNVYLSGLTTTNFTLRTSGAAASSNAWVYI